MINKLAVNGIGIGIRSEYNQELVKAKDRVVDFLELAPENWIHVGGAKKTLLQSLSERYPIIAHGLCLSIGGPSPLNTGFLQDLKQFIKQYDIAFYSEHLSYCSDEHGYLYDLMPIPFTEEAVTYVARRIRQVQDVLGQRIAMENVSYYCAPGQAMSEVAFINAVLAEADCDLLLDINNVYVNSINHGYNPYEFLKALNLERVAYVHVAGHYVENENLLIDTHGDAVCDEVWDLLAHYYNNYGYTPTLLERDNNVPALVKVLAETDRIRTLRDNAMQEREYG